MRIITNSTIYSSSSFTSTSLFPSSPSIYSSSSLHLPILHFFFLPGLSLNILNVALLARSSAPLRTELLVLTARTPLLVLVLTAGAKAVVCVGMGWEWELEKECGSREGCRLSELACAADNPPKGLLSLPLSLSKSLTALSSCIPCTTPLPPPPLLSAVCVSGVAMLSSLSGFPSILFK